MTVFFTEGFDWAPSASEITAKWGGSLINGDGMWGTFASGAFGTGRFLRHANSGGGGGWSGATGSFGQKSEIFGSARIRRNGNSAVDRYTWWYFNNGTNDLLTFRLQDNGDLRIFNSSGTLLATASGFFPVSTWISMQWRIVFHNTAGILQIRQNGASTNVVDLTNVNTRGAAATNWADRLGMSITGSLGVNFDYDDLIMADTAGTLENTWLGDVRIETSFPTGAGASTGLTPNTGANWAACDDVPHDTDTTYVAGTAAGQYDLYAMSALPTLPTRILTRRPFHMSKKTDAGARTSNLRIRSGTTEVDVVSNPSMAQSYEWRGAFLETDPNTGLRWANTTAVPQVGSKVEA